MSLPITESIEAIRNKIASVTGERIILGMPDDSEPGLFLFPYNFSENTLFHNAAPMDGEPQVNQAYDVKCLLIPSPSIDYAVLSKGYSCLTANPWLNTDGGRIRVMISNISVEELSSLFISAGTTYRLSIPFEISCSAS